MSAVLSFPKEPVVLDQAPAKAPLQLAPIGDLGNFVSIRGVRLSLDELVDKKFFTPEACERMRAELFAGQPCPHLVIDGLFNPTLLDLVTEEFNDLPKAGWVDIKTRYEQTRRSLQGVALGPASQIYFDILNSGWFTEWLSSIVNVHYLVPDPKLSGGGLHESQTGATFAVHRDFNRHRHLGLKNEMVFITYLNKGWQPEWGSALELWDKKANRCVTTIQPEFGRTLLLPHGPTSYHGHPKPLNAPDGRPRRSVAAYFYSSQLAGAQHEEAMTAFLQTDRLQKFKIMLRAATPPMLWSLARRLTSH